MTATWSREVLLARLVRERYGDPEILALEATLPVIPKPQARARGTQVLQEQRLVDGQQGHEPEHVLAGRRFVLLRGFQDVHPDGPTWRRCGAAVRLPVQSDGMAAGRVS